ncbi:MAG: hypothetical protein AB1805_10590 [Nitrospirota bacterium]
MRRLAGYKIIDEEEGFVPDLLDEAHLFTDMESLNRFFRYYEHERQWIVIPVYQDRRPGEDQEPPDYHLISREEAEALIPENDYPGRKLIGYQIVTHDEYLPPENMDENEIFTAMALINRFFLDLSPDDQRWIVIPVYEGDIEHPEVVTDPF